MSVRSLCAVCTILAVWLALAPSVLADKQTFGKDPGSQRLDALGLHGPYLLTSQNPVLELPVELPKDASQGEPLWFGVRLHWIWHGHLPQVDDRAYVIGRWNGQAFYQFKLKKLTDISDEIEWSMVDLVNGESRGIEVSEDLEVASTNFMILSAVRGGGNVLTVELDTVDVESGQGGISVEIMPDSVVMATDWSPSLLDTRVDSAVADGDFRVSVEASNQGWPAPRTRIDVVLFNRDGSRRRFTDEFPGLGAGETFRWHRSWPTDDAEPAAIDVWVDWGTGRSVIHAWPKGDAEGSQKVWSAAPARTAVFIIAIVGAWVSIPALISGLRTR